MDIVTRKSRTQTAELYMHIGGWPLQLYIAYRHNNLLENPNYIKDKNQLIFAARASCISLKARVPPNHPALIGGDKHQFLHKKEK